MRIEKKIRIKVWKKYDCKCAYCGDYLKYTEMQVDHIIPKSNWDMVIAHKDINTYYAKKVPAYLMHLELSDMDHIDNYNPSCRICNKFKDTFTVDQFKVELSYQAERARKKSANYRRALKFGQIKETPQPIKFHFENYGS